jgi:2,4-dienoyl-CoA reductase-like NADH-dependent reductase (Old Yellow Enzyme family)
MQLLSPARLGPLELGNRMVMAPLTRCRFYTAGPEGYTDYPTLKV